MGVRLGSARKGVAESIHESAAADTAAKYNITLNERTVVQLTEVFLASARIFVKNNHMRVFEIAA